MKKTKFSFSCCNSWRSNIRFPNTNFMKLNSSKFKISLAQWSLHKAIKSGKLSPLDFAKKARSFDIDGIEFVSGLYTNHTDILKRMSMDNLAKELIKRSDDYGIDNVLIMIDGEGDLSTSDSQERKQAIENHKAWINAASKMGCSAVRLNLHGEKEESAWIKNP